MRSNFAPVLVLAAAGLLLLPCVVFVAARLALPGDDTQFVLDFSRAGAEGLMVKPLEPASTSLRTGDVVVSVEDRSVEAWLADALAGRWRGAAGRDEETVSYGVARDGQVERVSVRLSAYPLARVLADNWTLFLFIIYEQAIALFVFFRRPHLPAARLFLVLSSVVFANLVVFSLGMQVSDLRTGWLAAIWLFETVIMYGPILSLLLHLSLVFPRRQPLLERGPAVLLAVYLAIWIAYVLVLAARWQSVTTVSGRILVAIQSLSVMAIVYLCLTLASWLYSYRTSHNARERRQIGWVLWGMAVALIPYLLLSSIPSFTGNSVPFGANFPLIGLFFCAIPTTSAIAILREQLFDIDLIIRRTLIYGLLTASLAVVYVASILLLRTLFRTVTGEQPEFITVISTLLIAALFVPLRRLVQNAIDRRYFRRKYDAAKTLASFGETVRDEVDLERVSEQLLAVVNETMRPEHSSLWLREPSRHTPAQEQRQ